MTAKGHNSQFVNRSKNFFNMKTKDNRANAYTDKRLIAFHLFSLSFETNYKRYAYSLNG